MGGNECWVGRVSEGSVGGRKRWVEWVERDMNGEGEMGERVLKGKDGVCGSWERVKNVG